MVDRDLDDESRLIRMFPGYAGTVLWTWFGPVEYPDSLLSSDLIEALRVWEMVGEREVTTGEALSDAEQREWSREGARLATALSAELGAGFRIEMSCAPSAVLASSRQPPTNPNAAALFEARRVAGVEEHLRRERRFAGMTPEEGSWFRYEPVKGRGDEVDA